MARVDLDAPGPVTANAAGRRLFSVELAKQFGYHYAPTQKFDRQRAQEIAVIQYTPSEASALELCQGTADQALPPLGESLSELLSFQVDVTADVRVVASVADWRQCLESAMPGMATGWPEDMPGRVEWGSFGLDRAVMWDAPPPSEPELALAVQDVICRESSGFSASYYEAEWSAQEAVLRQNYDALAATQRRVPRGGSGDHCRPGGPLKVANREASTR